MIRGAALFFALSVLAPAIAAAGRGRPPSVSAVRAGQDKAKFRRSQAGVWRQGGRRALQAAWRGNDARRASRKSVPKRAIARSKRQLERAERAHAKRQLTDQLFADIREVGEMFREQYPPGDYVYVGVGRTPHGVLGYLEAVAGADVVYIPMSNAKWHFRDPSFKNTRTPEREKFVKDHVRRFLPGEKRLRGRSILLVDFVDGGSGLAVAHYYLVETLFESGFDLSRLRAVGLEKSHAETRTVWRTRDKQEQTTLRIDSFKTYEERGGVRVRGNSTLRGEMMYGQQDDWLTFHSPVGPLDLQTLKKGKGYAENRPEYREYLRWLRKQHAKHARD